MIKMIISIRRKEKGNADPVHQRVDTLPLQLGQGRVVPVITIVIATIFNDRSVIFAIIFNNIAIILAIFVINSIIFAIILNKIVVIIVQKHYQHQQQYYRHHCHQGQGQPKTW